MVGSYINQDPIGLNGDSNEYIYVGGQPSRYYDPLVLVPNPAEAACILGPNPVCIVGVIADIGTWILGASAVGGGAIVIGSISGSTQKSDKA